MKTYFDSDFLISYYTSLFFECKFWGQVLIIVLKKTCRWLRHEINSKTSLTVVTVLRARMVEIDVVIKDPPNRFSKANTVLAVSFTKKYFQ